MTDNEILSLMRENPPEGHRELFNKYYSYDDIYNYIEAKRNSDEKNKLKENLNQKTEEIYNLENKFRIEKRELEEKYKKEIQELKFRLKDAEDKNMKLKVQLFESENKYKE